MKHYESQLQAACCKFFKLQYPRRLFFHVPNERKDKMDCIRLSRMGVMAGVPDIFIPEPISRNENWGFANGSQVKTWKHGLWIELKWGDNLPGKRQIEVMRLLRERDYIVEIAKTVTEFAHICDKYFKGEWD